MKIFTSYFYQVRFFKPNMVPFSTAIGDPAWYHHGYDKSITYYDKRDIINGLRIEPLHPGIACEGLCHGTIGCQTKDPSCCEFLRMYKWQLRQLDFQKVWQELEDVCGRVRSEVGFLEEPVAVLLVHEAPWNPCSERRVIQEWFTENGVSCTELEYPI